MNSKMLISKLERLDRNIEKAMNLGMHSLAERFAKEKRYLSAREAGTIYVIYDIDEKKYRAAKYRSHREAERFNATSVNAGMVKLEDAINGRNPYINVTP